MKPTKSNHIVLVLALLTCLSTFNLQLSTVHAQGTAFTYQGKLNDNGNPASGIYDLRFTVYDAVTNGNLVAGPLTNSATGVTNGLLAATLDFGSGVFTGPARWLELDVRTNGGGAFTTLLPLQQILPMPYAIMANTASNLLGTLPAAQLSGTLPATQLSGTIPLAQLSASVLTNNASGVNLNGTFSGNGAGLAGVPGTFTWQNVTGTNQQAQPNTGYLATNAAQVTITLPASPNVGDIVGVSGVGAGGWLIAPNIGQSVLGAAAITNWNSLTNWSHTSAPVGYWRSVASSADGNKLVAAEDEQGWIFTSTNAGATWTQTSASNSFWYSVASSGDGTKLVAVDGPRGIVITSTNSGATWAQTSAPNAYWYSAASSKDGTKLVVVPDPGEIYTSTNSGATWTQTSTPNYNWFSVASSADGTKLVAGGPYVYTSINSGATWMPTFGPINGPAWSSIGSSADGSKLVATAQSSGIYTSTNAGVSWTQTSTGASMYSVASSADGTKLVAGGYNGGIYTSTNSGATWTQTSAPNAYWYSAASSDDGTRVVAVVYWGGIWTAQATIQTNLIGGQSSSTTLQYLGNGLWQPLNQSQIAAGAVGSAQLATNLTVSGTLAAAAFIGNGSGLTGLSASQLTTGTVPLAQLSGITSNQLDAATWQLATNLNGGNAALASNVVSGIAITNAFITNSVFAGNGGGLTNLNASQLTTGTVPLAQLPTVVVTNLPTAANYLLSYSTTTQAVATASTFQDITNQVDAQISGWLHTAGLTSFTNAQTGLYLVEYTAIATVTSSTATTISLRAVLNGTEIADSQSTAVANTASQTVPISKSFIASFNSGDVLKFQFSGSGTIGRIVSNTGLGTTRPSFSCTIIRIQ